MALVVVPGKPDPGAIPGFCPAPQGGKAKVSWVSEPGGSAPARLGGGMPRSGKGEAGHGSELGHWGQLGDTELVALGKQRLLDQRPPLECASWRLLCSSPRCPRYPADPEGTGNTQRPRHSSVGCPGDGWGVPKNGHSGIFPQQRDGQGARGAGQRSRVGQGKAGKQGSGSGTPEQGQQGAKWEGSRRALALLRGAQGPGPPGGSPREGPWPAAGGSGRDGALSPLTDTV